MTNAEAAEHLLVQVDYSLIEALQAREQQLAQAQRLAHVGSWEWDILSDTAVWSDELYRIFGLQPGELQPSYADVLTRIHPDDRAGVEVMVTNAVESLSPWTARFRILRPDGQPRHVEGRAEVVTDPAGVAVRMHGTVRDRTETEQLLHHFHAVATALEIVRSASHVLSTTTDVADAVVPVMRQVSAQLDWRDVRVWERAGDGSDHRWQLSSGAAGDETSARHEMSSLAWAAVADRHPHARDDAATGRTDVVLAAPIVVEGESVLAVEFDADRGVTPERLVVDAIHSVCSTVAERLHQDRRVVLASTAAEAHSDVLVRHATEAIAVLDAGGTIVYATPACARLLGYPDQPSTGISVFDLVHPDDRAAVTERLETLSNGGVLTDTARVRMAHADGGWRQVEVTRTDVSADPFADGSVVVNLHDVTEQVDAEQLAESASTRDPLTGLMTRVSFADSVDRALSLARRLGWSSALFSVDLDDFHVVNEAHGFDTGDEVLKTVAARLRTSLRGSDLLARGISAVTRMGGDEFLLLCDRVRDESAAQKIASRVLEEVADPIVLADADVALSASVGVAISDASSTPDQMIVEAEAAQRHAKQSGGGRHRFFTSELHDRAATAADLVRALREAVSRDELRLLYQPKISLATNRIVGVEALLRWERPGHGIVMPGEFIPAAETSGVIIELGAWVVAAAARQAAAWRDAYPRLPLQLAVNVSARQFHSRLANTIFEATDSAGVPGACVCLEMTETTVMEDIDATVGILDDLKVRGFTVSIDDFGTGYSSLEYLHRMPIDEVKIDRSFVAGLGTDATNTAIVASVISLAHAMNLEVVAEGVETLDQLERLQALGCDFAQGFVIAKPVPAAEIDEYLAADAAGQELPRPDPTGGIVRPGVPETVLIVDDTPDVRMLARMSLTAAGFTVEEAGNGAAALALARRMVPACILLDVSMPDMSGIDVCRELRLDPRTSECTIVILTTRADAADKAEAFLVGADDYIVKPFAPRDLVTRLRAALRRRQTAIGTIGRQVDAVLLEMLELTRGRSSGVIEQVPEAEQLSDRQLEILKRLVGGERVPGIARDLYISQSTVRNHLSVIYQRLGVHSQEELLALLRRKTTDLGPRS